MTDAFTQSISREVAKLLIERGDQIQTISPESSEGFEISPDQVLEVMQGNSQWLAKFEQEIEQSFQRMADKALNYWLKNTDKEIRASLKALTRVAEILASHSKSSSFSSNANSNSSNSDPLANAIGDFAGSISVALLQNIFQGGTDTSSAESARSRETSNRYRASRGQTQAEISKQLSRGARYT